MGFIQDFIDLQQKTPRLAIIHTNSENCAYTNYSTFNRNCYLVYGTHYSEDVYHSQYCVGLTSCADCLDIEKSELCYECVFCEKCYNCNFCSYLINCIDCDFSYDLTNCQNCFLSSCLQNESYCILNKKFTQEEYQKQRSLLVKQNSPTQLLKMLEELREKIPQRPVVQKNCENCLGSELRNSRNLLFCFRVKNAEDVIYGGTNCNQVKDSLDVDNVGATMSENIYNSLGVTGCYNLMCCNVAWFSQNCSYCELVFNSHDCFGCIGRNHAEYEILNVKYPKEEYFARVEEIKKELKAQSQWGQIFFEPTYPFQDTIAAQYFAA